MRVVGVLSRLLVLSVISSSSLFGSYHFLVLVHTHHFHIILMSAKVQPPVGYKPIEGNCPLPEKVVNKKSNEIWLIRAPKDVDYMEVL